MKLVRRKPSQLLILSEINWGLSFYFYFNFFRPRKKLQERGALFQKARENIAFCLAAKSLAKKALPYSRVRRKLMARNSLLDNYYIG